MVPVREQPLSALDSTRCVIVAALSAFALLCVMTSVTYGQQQCLEPGRLATLRKQIAESNVAAADSKLHDELMEASEEFSVATRAVTMDKLSTDSKDKDSGKPKKKVKDLDTLKQENIARVCSILNTK